MRRLAAVAVAIILSFSFAGVVRAQSTSASITGRVTDPQKALIVGATVAAINAGTNVRYRGPAAPALASLSVLKLGRADDGRGIAESAGRQWRKEFMSWVFPFPSCQRGRPAFACSSPRPTRARIWSLLSSNSLWFGRNCVPLEMHWFRHLRRLAMGAAVLSLALALESLYFASQASRQVGESCASCRGRARAMRRPTEVPGEA
jgi:hypothetical protein